jgi:hypothetical protein
VTLAMLESKTLLCIPFCFEKWLFTHRKLDEELALVWKAFFQRQAVLPFLDWTRFRLKQRLQKAKTSLR